jgi:hypothetical protein
MDIQHPAVLDDHPVVSGRLGGGGGGGGRRRNLHEDYTIEGPRTPAEPQRPGPGPAIHNIMMGPCNGSRPGEDHNWKQSLSTIGERRLSPVGGVAR